MSYSDILKIEDLSHEKPILESGIDVVPWISVATLKITGNLIFLYIAKGIRIIKNKNIKG